jgi:iron(III) transport system substrate-binding protein
VQSQEEKAMTEKYDRNKDTGTGESENRESRGKSAGGGGLVLSRRNVLRTGLSLAALPVLSTIVPGGRAYAQGAGKPTTVEGFETGADVEQAEKEGSVVFYTHDSSSAASGICEAFEKDFPKITARYVSLQTGALFSRILSERRAGRYNADVIQFSDVGTAVDFYNKGGYQEYHSPQDKYYKAKYLSDPPGYFFWIGVELMGFAYNTNRVKESEAPTDWPGVTDPKWKGQISLKQATSGMQFVEWYALRRRYGDKFWEAIAKLDPKAFNSRSQLFDRLSRGDDALCVMAEWAGYELVKQKNAPVKLILPKGGVPSGPLINGVVDKAPHPQAARLFQDWLKSPKGQTFYQTYKYLFYGSVRDGMPPLPNGPKLSDLKLLTPSADHLKDFLASRDTFNSFWNKKMVGLL